MNDSTDSALPRLLIAILDRFGRESDPNILRLRQRLADWASGNDPDRFEAAWQSLNERILTTPHWLSMLFPQACADFPELLPLSQALSNLAHMPDARAQEAATAQAAWIAEQANLSNPEGLLQRLLHDLLHLPPDQGPAFLFLSRYYAWIDLLVAQFVTPEVQSLHERIFSLLHLQRSQWPNAYCSGYLYQGWEALGLSGIKPTRLRLQQYGVASLLSPTDRVLDMGANNGFLALAISEHVAHVDAVELNPFLVEIGRTASSFLKRDNVRFSVADIATWQPEQSYDAAFSLANHCTIDGRMNMEFEAYIAKLFSILKPGAWLFFESHNIFGPGTGAPGDDGDLDRKFDIVERYFEYVDAHMNRAFVPAHDVDKLFVVLRRRPRHTPDALRQFSLETARTRYRRQPDGLPVVSSKASMPEGFCVIPWIHLKIEGTGLVKQCCFASNHVTDDGMPYSLYSHRIEEIWNSDYMRQLRQDMRTGVPRAECRMCFDNEKIMGRSGRTNYNNLWLPRARELGLDNEPIPNWPLAMARPPAYYQLELGNVCNLACRMCTSNYSSRIAGDKVHGQWSRRHTFIRNAQEASEPLEGDLVKVKLLPTAIYGVRYANFSEGECDDGTVVSLVKSRASLAIPQPGSGWLPTAIRIELAAQRPAELGIAVAINGETVLAGLPDAGAWNAEIELPQPSREFTIDFEPIGEGALPLTEVSLLLKRGQAKSRAINFNRFSHDGAWYEQPYALYGEILRDLSTVRELYFTGGEPFALKQIPTLLGHIVDSGNAPDITLSFSSNATLMDASLLENLRAFRWNSFWLSIDGLDSVYEYIRYPAKWSDVQKNLSHLQSLPHIHVVITPVIQLYNILQVTDIVRFFDEKKLPVHLTRIYNPNFLCFEMLPDEARKVAIDRIESYLAEGGSHFSDNGQLANLANDLRNLTPCLNDATFRNLRQFTNDLDASRGQSFTQTCPELAAFFAAAGHDWTAAPSYRYFQPAAAG